MPDNQPENPFKRKQDRYLRYVEQYRLFLRRYSGVFYEFSTSDDRYKQLNQFQRGFVETHELTGPRGQPIKNAPPPTVQFQFANIPLGLGRYSVDGEAASEIGASLVYSFGPTGATAVMLYPAKGNLGTTTESSILLRIGFFDADQLADMLSGDLRHWVDYAYVSAIDGDSTWLERARIRWLRWRQILYIDNKPQPAFITEKLKRLGGAAVTGSFSGIMKVGGGAAAGFALGYFVGG